MERYGWITHQDYTLFNALSSFTPGPNIIALAVLIGKKLAGTKGIAASLLGLLLPSAIITTLLAAFFNYIQNWPPLQGILKGILPATAGLMMVTALKYALPLLKEGKNEGHISLGLTLLIISACLALVELFQLPVALVLLGAGFAGSLGYGLAWRKA